MPFCFSRTEVSAGTAGGAPCQSKPACHCCAPFGALQRDVGDLAGRQGDERLGRLQLALRLHLLLVLPAAEAQDERRGLVEVERALGRRATDGAAAG